MNELAERIAGEIKNRGVISFADFMRLALYCPKLGFYEREKDRIGRHGDFYTSVSVGKIFGELLAFQFAEWLEERCEPETATRKQNSPFQVVEAGAHRGHLARDILHWLQQNHPQVFDPIQYWVIEPSARQRQWQRGALQQFESKIRWFDNLTEIEPISGIIFSNELLDAMPVHRITWHRDTRQWIEWGVGLHDGDFEWTLLPRHDESAARCIAQSCLSRLPLELLQVLPDGFTTEICPEAEDWWSTAALALRSGRLLAIDYGFTMEELLSPERRNGTLRAYFNHHPASNVLAFPGEQDITAHVDFSALQARGEAAGLKTELFITQSRFLAGAMSRALASRLRVPEWTPAEIRQFQTLTSPEHLGQSFRVLVQTRG